MTGLLVSVRDADEACLALEAGVDLIDIKEPRAGPLGAASAETIARILRAVDGARPVSVALGELADAERTIPEIFSQPEIVCGVSLAKIGLAGSMASENRGGASTAAWSAKWKAAALQVPRTVALVAVVYADWRAARAPSPEEVIDAGRALGCRTLLIDTFDKRSPGLLRFWSLDQIARQMETARAAGMQTVLAGRLTADDLPDLLSLGPDLLAVRGAICNGDRGTAIDPLKLRESFNAAWPMLVKQWKRR